MTYNIKPPAALARLGRALDHRHTATGRGSILPTYAEVAKFIGVCPTVLGAWLSGKCCPKQDKHVPIILAAAKFVRKH